MELPGRLAFQEAGCSGRGCSHEEDNTSLLSDRELKAVLRGERDFCDLIWKSAHALLGKTKVTFQGADREGYRGGILRIPEDIRGQGADA